MAFEKWSNVTQLITILMTRFKFSVMKRNTFFDCCTLKKYIFSQKELWAFRKWHSYNDNSLSNAKIYLGDAAYLILYLSFFPIVH